MHHNRMKRSFAFLLTMAMLLSLCLGAAGAQYPCVGFAARKLTVTRSASATGETLYTVPAGDAVYITGDSGDYYIIEYDGQPGYAAKSAVRLAGEVLVNNPDGAWLGAYTALRLGGVAGATTGQFSAPRPWPGDSVEKAAGKAVCGMGDLGVRAASPDEAIIAGRKALAAKGP